jgi:hypothetical protein
MQHKFYLLLSLIFLSIISRTLSANDDCVKVYKIDNNLCGELCLSKYISSFAIQFGGVKEGNCLQQNYTVFDHKEKMAVGPFGTFEINIYREENKDSKEIIEKSLKFLGQKRPKHFRNGKLANEEYLNKLPSLKKEITLYKITDEVCFELTLKSYIASFALNFGGNTEGNCEGVGYKKFERFEKIQVGPFGDFEAKIFIKN